MSWSGPLVKPQTLRLARAEKRHARQLVKAKADRAAARAERLKRDGIRREVWTRDRGACRVCGLPVKLKSDDVLALMHSHHVIYRSAGGEDGLTNEIALCAKCHNAEHRHLIDIGGDPMNVITIAVRHHEYGRVLSVLESPCPK